MPEYITLMIAYLFDALGFGIARHRSFLALGLVVAAVGTALVRVFIGHHHVAPVAGLVGAALTVVFTRWCARWLAAGGNAIVAYTVSDLSGRLVWWVGGLLSDGLRNAFRALLPSPPAVVTEVHAVPCSCEHCAGRVVQLVGTELADERDYLRRPAGTAQPAPVGPQPAPVGLPLRLVPPLPPEPMTYADWLPEGAHLPWSEGLRVAQGFGVSKSKFQRDRRAVLDAA